MTFLKRYLIPRLVQYVLIIWLGITIVFLIPRLTPNDPVMRMIGEMRGRGSTLEPGAMDGIIRSDRWFTLPSVLLITVTGLAAAVLGGGLLLLTVQWARRPGPAAARREPVVQSFLDVFPGPVKAEEIDS